MILSALRKVKHAGFVASKRGRVVAREARFAALTSVGSVVASVRPYSFEGSNYRRSFLNRTVPPTGSPSELPRRVFVVWTGDNPMTPNRIRNLNRLRRDLGLPVEVVTPETLDQWLVAGHPLHPAYRDLSLVHRSDYLRAYLMHHHGGGYVDLKAPRHSWDPVFAEADADPDAWLTGFRELSAASVVRLSGRLGHDLALHHRRLVGTAAFIVRSHTPLTAEWLREVERRLDYLAPQAAEHPGGIRGEVVGYPVSWTDLLGKVFQPLQLKYLDHVRVDDRLLLDFTDYQ
ncbi:hypothetical protein ACIQ00_07845 [Micrococcus luteus]|uniref:hypothetical protein n=1 Tax=Micrococcus luteus TaxID=1270 RepID=UPI00341FF4C0